MYFASTEPIQQINGYVQQGFQFGTTAGAIIASVSLALSVAAYFFYKI